MSSTVKQALNSGVILDTASLGPKDLNLEPLLSTLPAWQMHAASAPDQVPARIAGHDLIVTNKVVIDAELMAANPQLKLICVAATGTNNVDLQAAKAQGITVCNVVNYGPNSVAQHALMLMLNLATNAQRYRTSANNGEWSKSPFFCLLDYPIVELAGKNLGIVGYGVLGQQVAQLGRALGMNVLISARPNATEVPSGRVSFAQVLAQSDVLSLHCPLTASTEKMMNSQTLAHMKPSAFLINCARGGLIDEPALALALRAGQLAGAGLDVLSQEPPPANHPLLAEDIPNLILTPHTAWASREARQNLVDIMTDNIANFIAGRPQNCV
ncbi:D-2-hydroxyacid dehydrogenase [Simiduia curdlanivorans]|uniref:D-2-hydroxyacid dehydrogenase n=1 Tax=Simiduia curdlanivorans TaxID=1492769 RepID=A0ABV8V5U6_9GAMM|nr:D-2-hydroxyacid dehydrogenase [Simiduia curdlanivorans]MDN3640838.1 D-2-hydroxyacid dehydrogenase [Simiduia curdlanivorans]